MIVGNAIAIVFACVFGFVAAAGLLTGVPGLARVILGETDGFGGIERGLSLLMVGWIGMLVTYDWWGSRWA